MCRYYFDLVKQHENHNEINWKIVRAHSQHEYNSPHTINYKISILHDLYTLTVIDAIYLSGGY